ncbi:MAG: hypothetical protein ACPGQT_03610 [Rhodothermales bacterium]
MRNHPVRRHFSIALLTASLLVLAGTGFGIRTLFLGLPVRVDMAWPFDGRAFGDRHTYLSVGLDF